MPVPGGGRMNGRGRVEVRSAADLEAAVRRRHERWMAEALGQARLNAERPFGAVLVERDSERRLAAAVNTVHESPILHGETAAIDRCARDHPGVRWDRTILYTTAEPCPMCAAAIAWTGIAEVVVGTSIDTMAEMGIGQILLPCAEVLRATPFYRGRLVTGVLREDTDRLYADWAERLAERDSPPTR